MIPVRSRIGRAGKNADIFYDEFKDMPESRTNTNNEYVYDDLGRQIFWKRTIDGNVTNVYYTHGYGMEARRVGQTNHYMHSDILGSITAITNSAGSAMSTYEYDPYGIMLSGNTSVLGNFGFTGQEIDLETNLYHFPARYYEPYWGRFLTQDPYTNLPDDTRSMNHQPYTVRRTDYFQYAGFPGFCTIMPVKIQQRIVQILNTQIINIYLYAIANPITRVDSRGLQSQMPFVPADPDRTRMTNPPDYNYGADPNFKWLECMYNCLGLDDLKMFLLPFGIEAAGKGLLGGMMIRHILARGLTVPLRSSIVRGHIGGVGAMGTLGTAATVGQLLGCAIVCSADVSMWLTDPNYEPLWFEP